LRHLTQLRERQYTARVYRFTAGLHIHPYL